MTMGSVEWITANQGGMIDRFFRGKPITCTNRTTRWAY